MRRTRFLMATHVAAMLGGVGLTVNPSDPHVQVLPPDDTEEKLLRAIQKSIPIAPKSRVVTPGVVNNRAARRRAKALSR